LNTTSRGARWRIRFEKFAQAGRNELSRPRYSATDGRPGWISRESLRLTAHASSKPAGRWQKVPGAEGDSSPGVEFPERRRAVGKLGRRHSTTIFHPVRHRETMGPANGPAPARRRLQLRVDVRARHCSVVDAKGA